MIKIKITEDARKAEAYSTGDTFLIDNVPHILSTVDIAGDNKLLNLISLEKSSNRYGEPLRFPLASKLIHKDVITAHFELNETNWREVDINIEILPKN